MRWIVPLALAIAPVAALTAHPNHGGSADHVSYVLMTGDGSSTMSGDSDDFRRAEALRSGNAPMLYIRQDSAGFVIRDPAILRRAEAIVATQRELGRRQGVLGDQQGELGSRQGKLGAEQGRLGAIMADARVREMGDIGERMAALGRQQSQLGEQQAALGRQQAKLGEQQAREAELAKPKFRALVADAIRRGLAQRID